MAFTPQDFTNGNVLNDTDLDTMDGNIDEVRNSHKGPASPPSLVSGVRWIDDSGSIWVEKVHDGGGFLNVSHIDPSSDIVIPAELRRRNLIINEDMEIWQDGTSNAGLTAASRACADGYFFNIVSHGTWTVNRDTDVPTVAQAGRRLNSSFRALCTTTDATVNAGDFVGIYHFVEGYDYNELYQQPQHLSFWAKSTTTGTYGCSIGNDVDRSYVQTFTIDAANTWELKQFVFRDAPSGGTWLHTNGVGLRATICLAAGTTFQGTSGSWQTSNIFTTSAQTNLAATVNNNFFVTDMRLHGGTVRSPVIIPHRVQKIQQCHRRFTKTFGIDQKPVQNVGNNNGAIRTVASGTSASNLCGRWEFQVSMRASPTITTFSPSAATSNWSAAVPASTEDLNELSVSIVSTSAGVDGDVHNIHASADSRL